GRARVGMAPARSARIPVAHAADHEEAKLVGAPAGGNGPCDAVAGRAGNLHASNRESRSVGVLRAGRHTFNLFIRNAKGNPGSCYGLDTSISFSSRSCSRSLNPAGSS